MGSYARAITNGHARIMKISQEWRVYILGAMLCLALTLCSLNFSDRGGPRFMASLTLAGVVYLLARTMMFIAMSGTVACSASATTLISWFPAILPLRRYILPKLAA